MSPGSIVYAGKTVCLQILDRQCVELCFDRRGAAINKLDRLAIQELGDALRAVTKLEGVRGLLITSTKDTFVVGADITEFPQIFQLPDVALAAVFQQANEVMSALEDLPVPTVVAINGFALGGGLELALAADFRVMSTRAEVGLPEVTLGIFPGFGGTVRMPRVAGIEAALDWITSGTKRTAEQAMIAGVVDAVVPGSELRRSGLEFLDKAIVGQYDWRARRAFKRKPIRESAQQQPLIETVVRTLEIRSMRTHEPAALEAVRLMSSSMRLGRDAAVALETAAFVRVVKTQAAQSLVQIFLNEQRLKRQSKASTDDAGSLPMGSASETVRRVFAAYKMVLQQLVREGVDLSLIDQAFDAFGWPLRPEARELVTMVRGPGKCDAEAHDIIMRMMIAIVAEAARCLEDAVAGSPAEVDMALLIGLALPRYLGGALKYADWLGLDNVILLSERYSRFGKLYAVPSGLRARARAGENYY